ncbi:MAG: M20/M25/M40 family metallo-hydrolase [Acidobacteriota bacterium]
MLWLSLAASQAGSQGLAAELAARPDVRAALERIRASDEATVNEQIRIAEIPAPPFHEDRRGQYILQRFRQLGLQQVEKDQVGNVIGLREGTDKSAPLVVLSAHLDSVFPEDLKISMRREGRRIIGPGITDDARGLAVLLRLIEAVGPDGVRTRHGILFVATVGEEGLGDLRGVKHLFGKGHWASRIGSFVSIDGADDDRIVNGAVGSKRYQVFFRGPGGHSWGNFGRANPAHAMGRVIEGIARLTVPASPKTTYNVGRVGGGTSVNSIPFEVWMEIDLRSEDPPALARLDAQFLALVDSGVRAENAASETSGTAVQARKILRGERPPGRTDAGSPIVKIAQDASQVLGIAAELTYSSTDANIPISRGIPAITVGGGGRAGNAHAPDEWFDPEGSYRGVQRNLLLLLALAN